MYFKRCKEKERDGDGGGVCREGQEEHIKDRSALYHTSLHFMYNLQPSFLCNHKCCKLVVITSVKIFCPFFDWKSKHLWIHETFDGSQTLSLITHISLKNPYCLAEVIWVHQGWKFEKYKYFKHNISRMQSCISRVVSYYWDIEPYHGAPACNWKYFASTALILLKDSQPRHPTLP